jgi:hypothetical protein
MKKRTIFFCGLIFVLSLKVYNILSKPDKNRVFEDTIASNEVKTNNILKAMTSDFIYGVGPRFNPIKKTEFNKIRAFNNLIDPAHAKKIVKYHSVEIILIIDGKQSDIRKLGYKDTFSEDQLSFLRSLDYSTNLVVRADFEEYNKDTDRIETSYATPHLTIVPAKQAAYANGEEALISYLDEASKDLREKLKVNPEKMLPAKLFFTVTKEGAVKNLRLDQSSNYPEIDKKIIELLDKDKGIWIPAENYNGRKVDQELVVSYGIMGC